jgi:hypothetical protein
MKREEQDQVGGGEKRGVIMSTTFIAAWMRRR